VAKIWFSISILAFLFTLISRYLLGRWRRAAVAALGMPFIAFGWEQGLRRYGRQEEEQM